MLHLTRMVPGLNRSRSARLSRGSLVRVLDAAVASDTREDGGWIASVMQYNEFCSDSHAFPQGLSALDPQRLKVSIPLQIPLTFPIPTQPILSTPSRHLHRAQISPHHSRRLPCGIKGQQASLARYGTLDADDCDGMVRPLEEDGQSTCLSDFPVAELGLAHCIREICF